MACRDRDAAACSRVKVSTATHWDFGQDISGLDYTIAIAPRRGRCSSRQTDVLSSCSRTVVFAYHLCAPDEALPPRCR